jgi:hypothetical protein
MLRLSSSAFRPNQAIPLRYVHENCGGTGNMSPPLNWLGKPEQTQSLVIIVQDPDAPGGTFTHWVAYDLPAGWSGLEEGISAKAELLGFLQGRNDFGNVRYDGPCPPAGTTHRYFFYLYALDVPRLNLGEGATAHQVREQMQGHLLAQAELIGRFGR